MRPPPPAQPPARAARPARAWRAPSVAAIAIGAFVGAGGAALARQTGSITLRPVIRVEPGHAVTLADVALLDGEAAEALSSVVVLASPETSWTTLDAPAIRGAIDEQARPVWGHLTLLGAECRVRAVSAAGTDTGPGVYGQSAAPAITDPTTLRAVVEQRLALALACTPDDLRLDFDDRDAELLGTSVLGRTADVQPTGFSARMPLRVILYEGDRIVRSDAIRVGVLVRRSVLVTPSRMERGERLAGDTLVREERWLTPDVRPIVPGEADGLVLRARIAPGQVIEARNVELPLLARRGQTITAHAVGGAVALQIPARALEDGRAGDTIRCETIGPTSSRSRRDPARQFLVRLAAPGVGVVVVPEDSAADPNSSPEATPVAPATVTIQVEPQP